MSIEEAKAALDAANEEATQKKLALLRARIAASKLEAAYLSEGEEGDTRKLAGEWYQAEIRADAAKHEAKQAEDKAEKALEAYDRARQQQPSG